MPAVEPVERIAFRAGAFLPGTRLLAAECAVALSYDGSSHAVMMATPQDLEDFALGFSLTEGIVREAEDFQSFEIAEAKIGIELRIWLREDRSAALRERRRLIAGPIGCGLCGVESLAEAMRALPRVPDGRAFLPEQIMAAVAAMPPRQELNLQTRAVHAAAFWEADRGIVALREDVGRHNALDKLVGALARTGCTAANGIGILTSRLSLEMVQKAAMAQLPLLVAVSAPTALAVHMAEAAGITLVGIARGDGFEIFTHPHRISQHRSAHAA